ncbi:MAG: FAD/NAD(P)-binding protein [Rhodospirillales bacterium]|nr:FAD/NAD(P)-binding protein [Rhodospirillales bacterium]
MPMVSPDPRVPRPFRIEAVIGETDDVVSWDLRPVAGDADFAFSPGQFNMIYQFGVGEVPISISGDPSRTDHVRHTLRAVGSVTKPMAALERGSVIGVRGPYGRAWPLSDLMGKDVVVVAGGIGLAPLRPAVLAILAERHLYRRVAVLYGARTPRDILFRRDLESWSARLDTVVDATVDRAGRDWYGNVGVVTDLIARATFDPAHTAALVCGPEIMLRYAVRALVDRGIATRCIFVSVERNMKCAVGWCGRCQWGGAFVCRDGPVFRFDRIEKAFAVRQL